MENKEKKMLTTEDLNRTLGKKELYSIAFGHVIGSGVFSLIGIGIGYTGKSAWIGILLSAVFILLQALPFIVMAGTARFRGGYYSMMGTLWGPKFAGFYIVIFFASNVSLAMYAISCAQYLQGVLPQVPIVPVAVACLTIFFITNLLGIEGAAKLEIAMDIVLALAMTCFIVFGLPKVDYSTLFTVDFAPAGPMGIITCAVLLTWATAGGIDMVNLSAEAKNPTKDLPQVILVATIAIAIFYALIAMVAGGVLRYARKVPFKRETQQYVDYMIAKAVRMGVDIRLNTEVTPELVKVIAPDFCIAAVGSKALIPPIPGVEKAHPIMDMYDGKVQVGQKVVIVGGGLAGTEAALELAMQGKQVTLVEMGIDVARDANSIHKPALMMELKDHAEQVTILRRTTCTGIHDHGIVCRDADGKELTLDADTVILAAGMAPLRAEALALEPLSSEFRMVGDCKRPRQILEAVREGYDAAMEV